jgi:hypothetical protein
MEARSGRFVTDSLPNHYSARIDAARSKLILGMQ